MDALIFSSVVSDLRANAQLLLTNAPESFWLAFWGCGLLTLGASVRALTRRGDGLQIMTLTATRITRPHGGDREPLSESRA